MGHRITIAVKKAADGSGDPFHVFGWLRENMLHRYWYISTTWIDLGNSKHKRTWSSIELPRDPNAEFEIYTDPDTRERIMTFEFEGDDDLSVVRLRFDEVPLGRNVELERVFSARQLVIAMLEVEDDD